MKPLPAFVMTNISIRAPAKGATICAPVLKCRVAISIRAPAKGATACLRRKKRKLKISIRAPAKGATWLVLFPLLPVPYFNPRSREGSDRKRAELDKRIKNFNPRSREGSDVVIWLFTTFAAGFQSALPRRERLCGHKRLIDRHDFNPRSREGSDLSL